MTAATRHTVFSRALMIVTLIIAGEMVFGLPFHTARFFRPTLLEVFGFSNTQLGDLFAVYGVLAMLAYFPGGALADRYPAKALLSLSLVATALGGLYMATIPGPLGMGLLYGYWGITTIFLFWGALIRATRDWGGETEQGRAFGLLEAGRGVVAATVAALIVALFAAQMPDAAELATDEERRAAFSSVVLAYSFVTLAAAAFCWWLIPAPPELPGPRPRPFAGMRRVLGRPVVWAQAAIIVCAYCGYKGLDNYSLYAEQVLGLDEVESARLTAWGAYVRPIAALAAGLAADRFDSARAIMLLFAALALAWLPLAQLAPDGGLTLIYLNALVSLLAVFALRGVYFALLAENRTPLHLTGAATGMVSFVGYSPEIFFAPITGRILDRTPGIGGFHDYFLFLAVTAVCGMLAVAWLLWLRRHGPNNLWPETDAAAEESRG